LRPTDNNTSAPVQTATRRVTLASGVQIASTQQNGESVDSNAWRWVVYPDGSADNGGVVFEIGSERTSLYLPAQGSPRWIDGDLPDIGVEHWQSGELEQRVTS
jgi:hypothetical protein